VFRYDGLGRRVAIIEQDGALSGETRHLWCGETLCQARSAAGLVMRRYYEEGELADGAKLYYAQDHLGSVRDVVDANSHTLASYDYDPYGLPTRTTGTAHTDFRYAGLLLHYPSGLYLANYRAYDPASGRWISRDPIGEVGGINLYTYVGGNPLSYVDPLGLSTIVYNNNTNTMTLTNNAGQDVGTFPAYNNTTNPATDPASAGPYSAGTYPYTGYAPKASNPDGPFGSNGAFHFPRPDCPGCEIHSGRANKGGPQHKTEGCIRTTDEGTAAIKGLIDNGDPPTSLTVVK
jgi:RHS repeat-associated protein